MTHNTEVEENIKNALVPWMESFGTKETFDKVITAIDSLHRRVAELESLAYAVAVDIDSEGKIITHHQLQKARHDWLQEEIVKLENRKDNKLYGFSVIVSNDPKPSEDYKDGFLVGFNLALQTIIERYHSELDQEGINS